MDPLVDKYKELIPSFEKFGEKLKMLITDILKVDQIDIHLIEARIKSTYSLTEKMKRADKEYSSPLEQITDLVGLRVIVYYSEDVKRVSSLIEHEFSVDKLNSSDKSQTRGPAEFGYSSVHFVVSLSKDRAALPEWAEFKGRKAEIQIRTVLQHAWAAISHKLQYKVQSEVPVDLQRKLFRLSALLELADEEFLGLKADQQEIVKEIKKSLQKGETEIPIDALSIAEFLATSKEVYTLVQFAKKAGFSFEYKDDEQRRAILIPICILLGIKTITHLQSILQSSLSWAQEYLNRQMFASKGWHISPEFLCVLVLIGHFPDSLRVDYLTELGWHQQIAKRVISIARSERH